MTARIDYSDFTAAVARLNTASRSLQKELVDNLHHAAPRVEADIKAGASTSIQRRAASTVQVSNTDDGIQITGGGGGGLGSQLFAGGEFGGRKSTRRPYTTRSPNGTAYVVRRRTTMQFLPHLGNEGYFYWPAVRAFLPKLYEQQKATLERVIGGRR